ncbi:flagellar biosynthesis protein FlhB [Geobacter sp. DSM 9736]|uniref:flagellar biosynthesis protein FlhB n=1 Tax=Geobacter sp. DSM 9736 TaxID=1277350 RepID=UPI000B50497E|nr:flagellar biosynthesis protein FlhB [Geobacter sp. DSM 9736]SNB47045.1 flagellar biosynthetic protein FlhB [Geobacter sp. DSM 9736]
MSEDKHSKTEQPTARRLDEAKKKGNIPRSAEMTTTITLFTAIVTLYSSGGFMFSTLKNMSRDILSNIGTYEVTSAGAYSLMLKQFLILLIVLGPFVLIVMLAGIVSSISQGGLIFSTEKLAFDLTKLNPLNGMKKLLNKESAFQVLKSFVKIAIVGYVAYRILQQEVNDVIYLVERDIQGIVEFVSHLSYKIVLHTCGVMLILAVVDLAFVRWRFIENLKMTKQEVKDEHRHAEGDPQVKGKIKQMQFEQARRRMSKIIPTADVVITNPTHYAIALKYDRETMAAPVVIAKGIDFLAQKIKEMAREHKVMLVENRPLARELYATVKEGEPIPESLYAAVAEVLAYVYSIRGKV